MSLSSCRSINKRLLSAISLLLVAEQHKIKATIHTVHDAYQGKKQKSKKKAASKKLKKVLVACPGDTDEESQSLLVTQPQGTQQQ